MTIHPDLLWVIITGTFLVASLLAAVSMWGLLKERDTPVTAMAVILWGSGLIFGTVGLVVNLIAGFARGVQ